MILRPHLAALALAVFSSLVFTACSPRPATVADRSENVSAASRPIGYPASDYQEQARGVPGGTLRVSTSLDPGTLDFQLISHTNAKWLGRLIYDNLVYLDEKGGCTPWLAKSWTISPDGKTYTFHLRDDVTFSDGTKFDAEAVRANLARMRDPSTKAQMTTAYIEPYVDGTVIDAYTFQANLREPYSAFLNVLAQSWLGMVSPKALRGNPKGLAESPVGTGPFLVERYTRQQGVKLVRRGDYHWAPDFVHHEGPAYLERIEVEFVPEALIRYTSLSSGQFDFTIDAPPQSAASIRSDPALAFASRVNLGNPYRGVAFNVTKEPFTDVRVRKAFALAVDREGIAQITGFGEFALKTDFLSATTRYYDPSFQDVLRYNPEEAARLLDEAGWTGRDAASYRTKDGRRLSAQILVAESVTPSPVTVAIQSDVRKIGFELTIVQLTAAQITARRIADDYQILSDGIWHTNTPDGLYIVYHSRQIPTARFSGQNRSRLADPLLDDLLLRARHATAPESLQDLYSRAQRRLTELVPTVPLYENHTMLAWRRSVHGVVFDTSHNTPFFTATWLQKESS